MTSVLDVPEVDFHRAEYDRLVPQLETVAAESKLPNQPGCIKELSRLLIRVRLTGCATWLLNGVCFDPKSSRILPKDLLANWNVKWL